MFDEFGNPIDDTSGGDFGTDMSAMDTTAGDGGTMDVSGGDMGGVMLPSFGGFSLPGFGGGFGGSVTPVAGGVSLPRAIGSLRTVAGKVPWARLWPAVRVMGLPAVATALGIGADLLAQGLLTRGMKRHRRRGISARDVRTTRRVVRFVNRMQHDIGCVTHHRRAAPHRR